MRTDVAIVGGGLAGLVAARSLHQAGTEFILLEARERLGGRILSAGTDGEPSDDGFDLGPSWFWPDMQPGLDALVRELGLALFTQPDDGDILFELARGQAPQRYKPTLSQPASMRLAGGSSTLIRALARSLPADRIRLGARVTRVALTPEGAELATHGGDRIGAKQAILAVPPRLLEEAVHFRPTLGPATAELWRGTPTWMAPHAKVFVLYDRPFWRDAGLSGAARSTVGPLVEIHDATTATGRAALFGFVGVPAQQRKQAGQETIIAASVAQFTRLFGAEAASPVATLFKDWAADPLTATASDQAGGEHPYPEPRPWVSGVWQERIVLAGSETSRTEPGYLAGAVEAAERAVAEVASRLNESPAKTSDDVRGRSYDGGDAAMKNTYRAMQVTTPGTLELVERETPEPGVGEVLIVIEACGICGADVGDIEGAHPSLQPPRVPGHEVVGRIVTIGPSVPSIWKTGQRVGVGRLGGHCNECAQCRQGRFHLCRNQPVVGASCDGGYAEMMLARGTGLVSIPDELDSEEAAPILCAGIATFNALKKCGAAAGDLVAVFGIGGLGHMALQYACRMGYRVAAVGRGQDIAEDARNLGAHVYIDTHQEDAAKVLDSMGGAQAIIATVGKADDLSPLMGGLAPSGRLVVLAPGKDALQIATGQLVRGERGVLGSITGSPYENEKALNFSALTGARPWIETVRLENASEAYRRMKSGDVKFRMVLTMGETGHAH